ncbi:MAG: hypothetical protein WKG07_25705 [Hymenobacter sp.]
MLIRDGYGQSESTAMVYNLPGSAVRPGAYGPAVVPVRRRDCRRRGPPAARPGRGPHRGAHRHRPAQRHCSSGYFGEPERAASVFRHGLYYTGDKAYRDARRLRVVRGPRRRRD